MVPSDRGQQRDDTEPNPPVLWINTDFGILGIFAALVRTHVVHAATYSATLDVLAARAPRVAVVRTEQLCNLAIFLRTLKAVTRDCQVIVWSDGATDLRELQQESECWILRHPTDWYSVVVLARDLLALKMPGVRALPRSAHVQKTIEYLAVNYHSHFTIASIAKPLRVSARRLSEDFQEETGWRIPRFLAHVRIEVAKQRLATTADGLGTIARQSGFTDASHMSKVFWQVSRCRPGRYRDTVRFLPPPPASGTGELR